MPVRNRLESLSAIVGMLQAAFSPQVKGAFTLQFVTQYN